MDGDGELELKSLEGPVADIVTKYFLSEMRDGYLYVRGCFMPDHFPEFAEKVLEFPVRDDDVWVCTFPKTGTTWTQEMVWCIANDLDYESAKKPLSIRFPFIDVTGLFLKVIRDNKEIDWPDAFRILEKAKSPRFIKTHLPYNLLPLQLQRKEKKAKIITVTRNPKDVCVSYYHHCLGAEGYTGNFKNFTKLFLGDAVCYAPFSNNILSYWERRDDPDILFLKYEDMKKDLPSAIRKTASFLGKEYGEEQIAELADHLSLEKMRKTGVVRVGQVGGWRKVMDEETRSLFDRWTQDRFQGTGLSWPDVL